MSVETPTSSGSVDFNVGDETFRTAFKIFGDLNAPNVIPLIILHGGPGAAHNYLISLKDLAGPTRPVVFYDQLGCGESRSSVLNTKPKDFWTPDLFMDEFFNLIDKLLIFGEFDLLGHSWGGMLASQIAATRRPHGLRRLIISNSPASMHLWEVATKELIRGMPVDVQEVIRRNEEAGTTDSPEFERAMEAFYAKHMCRVHPMPGPVQKSFELMAADPVVYHTMNGPSEFTIIGTLKTWTIIPELHRIDVPTLVLNGRYDEAQDVCVLPFFQHIKRVKWFTFPESSHMPQWEERHLYLNVVRQFLESEVN